MKFLLGQWVEQAMNKTFLVAFREYYENLSTKTFWLGIFVFPIILVASLVVPTLLEKSKQARVFTVVDHSGWLHKAIAQKIKERDISIVLNGALEYWLSDENLPAHYPEHLDKLRSLVNADNLNQYTVALAAGQSDSIQLPAKLTESINSWRESLTQAQARQISANLSAARFHMSSVLATVTELNDALINEDLFAYFEISDDPLNDETALIYVSNNFTDESLKYWYVSFAEEIIKRKHADLFDIDDDVALKLTESLHVPSRKITNEGKQAQVDTADHVHQWVPVAFVYLLWLSVFSISQMLLTNTVEEKSNRIIEVLLSSVSPLQLMSGKIFGIAATGFTIILSWIVFFFIAIKILPLALGMPLSFDLTFVVSDLRYIGSFIAYFMFGYFFYAALLVGMGSVCNSLKEAQNLMTPVILILLVPMFAMVPVGQDPNGVLAKVMSYIPPFTPFVMMNRAAGPPSLFEYITTTLLMLVSIAFVFWGSAKVFRIGILLTGKPPKLREILRWLRAPVGTAPKKTTELE